MKPLKIILQATNPTYFLSPKELSEFTPYNVEDCKRYLVMLEQGGLVESNPSGKFKRDKKWRSKQRDLFR